MPKPYQIKDLGYTRTPTSAEFKVVMPDGLWFVPVQIIADSRDEHYSDEQEDTIGFIRDGSLSDYEIYDWSGNNMNWSDVEAYARMEPLPPQKIDRQEFWCNGDKEIIGTI